MLNILAGAPISSVNIAAYSVQGIIVTNTIYRLSVANSPPKG
ncbi:hypothetical protein [Anabaena sp. FACHB-1237]|nr:hypothetical protein [Anabaena sp. FACHB-1237]